MPSLRVVGRDGAERVIAGAAGASVMQAISDAGVTDLFAICGGCCICATCHVYVDADDALRLPPLSDEERDLLGALDNRRPTSRLSCQLSLGPEADGMRVTIAPEL